MGLIHGVTPTVEENLLIFETSENPSIAPGKASFLSSFREVLFRAQLTHSHDS